jgi:acetyl-CoA carboxylase biotin carboxyl carrier protein
MANNPKFDIDESLLRKLSTIMDETGLTEVEYSVEGTNIRLSKLGGHAFSASTSTLADLVPVAKTTQIASDAESHPGVVKSPMVGVAYTSSDPDTPTFIKVGDNVSEGQTLLLIEAMKVFNPILAPKSGRIIQVLITSGSPVEFGEPLVIIE